MPRELAANIPNRMDGFLNWEAINATSIASFYLKIIRFATKIEREVTKTSM
jgi:hypothetical protein